MKARLCTIYKGRREAELYLYVEKGSDLSQVPEELLNRFGSLQEVMTLKLDSNTKLARANAKQVLDQIASKGYFLQLPPDIHARLASYGE